MKIIARCLGRGIDGEATLVLLEKVLRVVMATVFIYSGVMKLLDPVRFGEVIAGFGLLPHSLIYPLAIALPVVEIVAGVGLFFSFAGSLPVIFGLLTVFIAVLGYGIYLGLDIDCGCFGPEDPEQAYKGLKAAMVRDGAMMVAVLFLYWRHDQDYKRSRHGKYE